MKHRIILTGSQGTGKTTILNHYKEQGMNVITEIVRNLAKTGVKINEMGDEEGQNIIFSEYERLLNDKNEYMSDRGLTDVAAYTFYHVSQKKIPIDVMRDELKRIREFFEKNPDIIVCYFPIEFLVVDDGVRSTDERFRDIIDKNIKFILDALSIPYTTITGTVEERIKQIDDILKK